MATEQPQKVEMASPAVPAPVPAKEAPHDVVEEKSVVPPAAKDTVADDSKALPVVESNFLFSLCHPNTYSHICKKESRFNWNYEKLGLPLLNNLFFYYYYQKDDKNGSFFMFLFF